MLYLACLIRAREPEDKSGWSDGGRLTATSRKSRSPLEEERREIGPFLLNSSFSIRREISLLTKERVILCYIQRSESGAVYIREGSAKRSTRCE